MNKIIKQRKRNTYSKRKKSLSEKGKSDSDNSISDSDDSTDNEDSYTKDRRTMTLQEFLNYEAKYESLKDEDENVPKGPNYNWHGHIDRITMAEKLKDAYNEGKTMLKEKVKSKTSNFYRWTRPLRVILVAVSLVVLVL